MVLQVGNVPRAAPQVHERASLIERNVELRGTWQEFMLRPSFRLPVEHTTRYDERPLIR